MSTVINTNLLALNTQRQLSKSAMEQQNAMQRLSSGLRINSAKDDAAGLAISDRMTSQTRGLAAAVRNTGDAISLSQTAEGALGSIGTNLQRIRELALQSANGTNTSVDRKAIQVEAQQLKDEIQSISDRTNFNGKKLLDGSFGTTTLQTGANIGESINVSLSGARTDQLGAGQSAGVSTVGATDRGNAMAAGDLILNGVSVGAALAGADGSSTTKQNFSSIAIAAAINAVSDNSGVTAIVNANSVQGVDVTAAGVSNTPVTFSLNGVSITAAGSGVPANLLADLKGVADQINLSSAQSAVTASIDEQNLKAGVILTAADGRNIDISTDATTVGVGKSLGPFFLPTTYFGGVTLVSKDGSNIDITSSTGSSLENVGIETGSYKAATATAVSDSFSLTMNAGDLVINGVSIGAAQASYDTASSANRQESAIAKAAAINLSSDKTGVTAVAGPTTETSAGVTTNTGGTLTLNGVSIAVAAGTTGTTAEQVGLFVNAINAKSSQTGIKAVVNDASKFTLVADDGRNIEVTSSAGGVANGTSYGTVRLTSGDQINISTATGNISGFRVGTYGSNESGQMIKDIDVSTVAGATKALSAIDNALAKVNSQRADMGAIQNRLDSTISNLQLNAENLTAANSRIKDADFALETGELSRAQILQQAGTAMLAQANSSTQGVLSLLR
ncbi:MAG TPA: flagellin [Methylobacter sp.]|jgi:flagellin